MSEYPGNIEEKIKQAEIEKDKKNKEIKQEAEGLLKKAIDSLSQKELLDLANGTEVNKVIDMQDTELYGENPVSLQAELETAISSTKYEGKFKITYEPVGFRESKMKITIVKKAEVENTEAK